MYVILKLLLMKSNASHLNFHVDSMKKTTTFETLNSIRHVEEFYLFSQKMFHGIKIIQRFVQIHTAFI